MRILVLTPIEKEFDSLTARISDFGYVRYEQTTGRLPFVSFLDGALVVAPGGLGKAQFGIQTQHAIDMLHDREMVICAGTAGGLRDDLKIGDVVVATETVEHDFKWGILSGKPLPRFPGDQKSIDVLKTKLATMEMPFDVHFGIVASGDEGIVDPGRAEELRRDTDAMAVAWEGAGGARAAAFSGLPYLEVRGISDGAGEDAQSEFEANLPHAVGNVAEVVLTLAQLRP